MGVTVRRSLSTMQRLAVFERNGGICHLCERKIRAGELWDVSHDRPIGLLGADHGDNLKVAHRACHKIRTAEHDLPSIAKAKRVKAKHIGAWRSSHPMQGSKASGWKKKVSGEAVRR